eukprot:TRINITY_DN25430_c0_g1_i1.p1 TRINITY_DN25430_c0_g1~~TRINITY_DN25430_c0_g1_i1.p1  ORF type:complete len:987 (+),score=230.48 TRINITY_DN25430_c0_g1_i1:98-2962(+)
MEPDDGPSAASVQLSAVSSSQSSGGAACSACPGSAPVAPPPSAAGDGADRKTRPVVAFVSSTLPSAIRDDIAQQLRRLGAEVAAPGAARSIGAAARRLIRVTHCVVGSPPQRGGAIDRVEDIPPEELACAAAGKWLVPVQWVEASEDAGRWADEAGAGGVKGQGLPPQLPFHIADDYLDLEKHAAVRRATAALAMRVAGAVPTALSAAEVVLLPAGADPTAVLSRPAHKDGLVAVHWEGFIRWLWAGLGGDPAGFGVTRQQVGIKPPRPRDFTAVACAKRDLRQCPVPRGRLQKQSRAQRAPPPGLALGGGGGALPSERGVEVCSQNTGRPARDDDDNLFPDRPLRSRQPQQLPPGSLAAALARSDSEGGVPSQPPLQQASQWLRAAHEDTQARQDGLQQRRDAIAALFRAQSSSPRPQRRMRRRRRAPADCGGSTSDVGDLSSSSLAATRGRCDDAAVPSREAAKRRRMLCSSEETDGGATPAAKAPRTARRGRRRQRARRGPQLLGTPPALRRERAARCLERPAPEEPTTLVLPHGGAAGLRWSSGLRLRRVEIGSVAEERGAALFRGRRLRTVNGCVPDGRPPWSVVALLTGTVNNLVFEPRQPRRPSEKGSSSPEEPSAERSRSRSARKRSRSGSDPESAAAPRKGQCCQCGGAKQEAKEPPQQQGAKPPVTPPRRQPSVQGTAATGGKAASTFSLAKPSADPDKQQQQQPVGRATEKNKRCGSPPIVAVPAGSSGKSPPHGRVLCPECGSPPWAMPYCPKTGNNHWSRCWYCGIDLELWPFCPRRGGLRHAEQLQKQQEYFAEEEEDPEDVAQRSGSAADGAGGAPPGEAVGGQDPAGEMGGGEGTAEATAGGVQVASPEAVVSQCGGAVDGVQPAEAHAAAEAGPQRTVLSEARRQRVVDFLADLGIGGEAQSDNKKRRRGLLRRPSPVPVGQWRRVRRTPSPAPAAA